MNEEITITVNYTTALCVIAQIQLASRHPGNTGQGQKLAADFARQLQQTAGKLHPEHQAIMEMGWNPDFYI